MGRDHARNGLTGRLAGAYRAPVARWSADPRSERDIFAASLADPIGCPALGNRDLTARRILFVVDDNTRPTPVHRLLDSVLDELERAGASLANVLLSPALGIHSPMSEAEMAEKAGADNLARLAWKNHDA